MKLGRPPQCHVEEDDLTLASSISWLYRRKFRLTKRLFASQIGTHPTFIGNIEAGKGQRPSWVIIEILALEPMLKRTPEYI